MARVSFTLRRPTSDVDLGSYLRYDDAYGVRTDIDSALRADGLQIAPLVFSEAFFEAATTCYGEVALSWAVNIVEEYATPDVTGIVVVYSPNGEPQTIASGTILVESSDQFAYEHTGVTEGRWAYYSLFVHYTSSGGDDYYEKAGSLAVLAPKNYGSNMMLWNRIPEYYRIQDTLLGDSNYSPCIGTVPADGVVGPLFKYLSVIGFDMDRIRTMLDYHMVSFDPQLANTEHLDALAQQMDVLLRRNDLGGARLRSLMDDIGFFRRSKGTASGTEFFGRAVSGGLVDIDQVTGEITVYSQRVNYITTPKNGSGITTYRAALDTEAVTPLAFSSTAASAGEPGSYSVSGSTFTTTGTGASLGISSVLLHLSSPVPVQLGDRVGFSVQRNVGTSAIKWARLVNGAGATVGFEDTATSVEGSRIFEITASTNASVGIWTTTYVEYLVDLSEVAEFKNELLLAERNYIGKYFDGDTKRGGWLIDASSISDFRWSGSANASCSVFAEDYERMKSIVNELLFDVLPVTEVSKYTITAYNAIPGL